MYGLNNYCKLCNRKLECLKSVRIKKRWISQNDNFNISELAAGYKPHEMENIKLQEDYFSPKAGLNEKSFSMVLPPPNITGTLHLGHALTASIQDVLVKWRKMHGQETMWVPGLDHAGIATQVIVEKKLWKEKSLTRHEFGRKQFENEVWKWKKENSLTIVQQLRRLNVSLNWDKETFTMDEQHSRAVLEAFIRLFDEGLIYRADHLVNWSCILQSAISDIEVDHVNLDGPTEIKVPGYDKPIKFGVLSKFAYKIVDSDDELVVATTRPETMLGDVAVAVNPKDARYSNFIGKHLTHPFRNDVIPVIADDFVDPSFGTGAVKITPAHDPKDFEASKRHDLKRISIIDEKGCLTSICEDFKGIKRFDARQIIINRLVDMDLFRGNQDHAISLPVCSRSSDIVEFLIRPQWFIKCSEMAQRAVHDVKSGKLQIEPRNLEKVWFHWLDNIRDWCISRQLWWGHQIPAYECYNRNDSATKTWVAAQNNGAAKTKAAKVLNCAESEIVSTQDEDVLDTWFSSGLQPFSVFGWPEQTEDLQKHYPLSLMETGHDIVFFWVARMVMLGTKLTGVLPFNKIVLHGIVCDAHGRKMSKSLGNVIAPEDVIRGCSLEKLKSVFEQGILSKEEIKKALQGQQKMFPNGIPECGADALRFTLLSHNIKSYFINFDVSECHTNRLFCNKVWQATKFALLWYRKVSEAHDQNRFLNTERDFDNMSPMDNWILSRLSYMIESVNTSFENFDFNVATSNLKNFLYYEFCDIYLESIKTDLKENPGEPVSKEHCRTLLTCLDLSLRALYPFMPTLSQHLHEHLPRVWSIGEDRSFPKSLGLRNKVLEKQVAEITDLTVCIRRLKKIFNITFKYQPEVYLVPNNFDLIQNFSQVIKDLSSVYTLNILSKNDAFPEKEGLVEDFSGGTKVFLVVPEDLRKSFELDFEKMEKKKKKLFKELEKVLKMVDGKGYKEKATSEAKEIHAKKISLLEEKIARINYIQGLSK